MIKHKKIYKYIFLLIIVCGIVYCMLVSHELFWSPNSKLFQNEIKAYFKPTVHLDYHPNIDNIERIQIGGIISMSHYDKLENGNAVYTDKGNINMITDYLNKIPLVMCDETELPNISSDSYIQYVDTDGDIVKNFTVFGMSFIKDVSDNQVYRIKYNGNKVFEKFEKLKMSVDTTN